jgi:heme exporter protein CcmD
MDWNADYAGFVFAAYGIVNLVLLVLLIYTLWRAKILKAKLADMKLSDPGQKDKP